MATVLIVDDARVMRHKLRKMIEAVGHSIVAEASNGLDAFTVYKQYVPDLVTMDVSMPTMDGIQAVEKIIKTYPDARIIMTTSHKEKSTVLKAIKAGAKHYIVKPVRIQKIQEVFNQVFPEDKEIRIIKEPEPFEIDHRDEVFFVTIYYNFREQHIDSIVNSVEPLLEELELKIVFDLSNVEVMSQENINGLGGLMVRIVEANGDLVIFTNSEKLKDSIVDFDINLKNAHSFVEGDLNGEIDF